MPKPKVTAPNLVQEINSKISGAKDTSSQVAGKIVSLGDGVALISGMNDVGMGEIVIFPNGVRGLALNLNQDTTGCVILGSQTGIKEGDLVTTTGEILSIDVSDDYVGRVVNPLGTPQDGKGDLKPGKLQPLERIAAGVIKRQPVNTPLQTGIKAVDAVIPIGRGQRELIIGDKSTGKSSIALTTIINQKDTGVICVYVAIGQKRSFIAQTMAALERHNAMKHTIFVAATASEPAALQYIAPYAGSAIAEYFLDQGKDVLIVYDDLTKHAWAYREISLLLRRPSGREAYPGDVFYLHSRLLERACKISPKYGGGSITALPIIETQANDVSAYIPTNVISITDGQIYLESDLFYQGQRPAINIGTSVSRVGSSAQIKAMKQVAGKLKLDLAQFRELAAFAQFSSDLDKKTKTQIDRGARVTEILKQHWENPMDVIDQVWVIWAASNGHIDLVALENVSSWEEQFLSFITSKHQKISDAIRAEQKITDQLFPKMTAAVTEFNASHSELITDSDSESTE